MSSRASSRMSPALIGSGLLHAAFAAALLINWPWSKQLTIGTIVPVNIVSNAPTTDLRAAVEADEEQTALAEEPVPDAPLEAVVAPEPAPEPAPPAAKAAPTVPTPAAKSLTPAQQKAPPTPKAATKPDKGLDLDALAASVARTKPGGAKGTSAPKGPARPETATVARPAAGTGLSANALMGLSEELQRRWNPNCEVEGGRDVKVKVTFLVGPGGAVQGEVKGDGQELSSNAVVKAAAERAIRAVYAASPFRNLPRDFYGQRVVVNFNAQSACS